ncbi:MAG: VOC family protein [Acidobacteriota bacterium]|jgi:PhnB protein
MARTVEPIPAGYHNVTPYLIVHDAAAALSFYARAFGAEERFRLSTPGGKIAHAEMKLGDSVIMLADEHPELGAVSPKTLKGASVFILLYVEDVDAIVEKALASGAKLVRPVADQFYGDRTGTLVDPFGHQWTLATHVENVNPEELGRRAAAAGLGM